MPGVDLGRLRASPAAAGWVALLRWVLALVFVLPGLDKLAGNPLNHGGPVLPFFEALRAVDAYWRFLGLGQVLGGVLLVVPRTAALGSLACLAVLSNIVVLVAALPFTPLDRAAVAILLAGHLAVLAWEWPRLAPLLGPSPAPGSVRAAAADAWRRRPLRFALAGLAVLWLVVHVADRLNDP